MKYSISKVKSRWFVWADNQTIVGSFDTKTQAFAYILYLRRDAA